MSCRGGEVEGWVVGPVVGRDDGAGGRRHGGHGDGASGASGAGVGVTFNWNSKESRLDEDGEWFEVSSRVERMARATATAG